LSERTESKGISATIGRMLVFIIPPTWLMSNANGCASAKTIPFFALNIDCSPSSEVAVF
jgi:hypothetical protein